MNRIEFEWTMQYRYGRAVWDGERVHIQPMVPGGVGWSEWASTWVDAMWLLRRSVIFLDRDP